MILNTWISPALLSFIPIFAGWYTTPEHAQYTKEHPEECDFQVNKVFAVISSSISFWIPCTIMLFTYYAIFKEANRQEKQLAARQGNAMLMHRHSSAGGTNGTYSKKKNQRQHTQTDREKCPCYFGLFYSFFLCFSDILVIFFDWSKTITIYLEHFLSVCVCLCMGASITNTEIAKIHWYRN